MDRDTKFCESFRSFLDDEGTEPVQLPAKSPNFNAHQKRFMKSIKSECLTRMIFFGETMLRNAVHEYLSHYHQERTHPGLDNKIIDPNKEVGQITDKIKCRERLGGTLRFYYHHAAKLQNDADWQDSPLRAKSLAVVDDSQIQSRRD